MDRSVKCTAAMPPHSAERLCLSRAGATDKRLCLSVNKFGAYHTLRRHSRGWATGFLLLALILGSACRASSRRSGLPAGAQTALDTAIEDINAGRYEKIYNDAAPEWRADASAEESKATLERLRDKLGKPGVRNQQTAREEQTGTGHAIIVIYQTSFERGDGMETFTLVEHGGLWQLAKYYVSSTALR